jgi:hypothetical protein
MAIEIEYLAVQRLAGTFTATALADLMYLLFFLLDRDHRCETRPK